MRKALSIVLKRVIMFLILNFYINAARAVLNIACAIFGVQRILENTPADHRDYKLLKQAETALHELAMCINTAKENKQSEDMQDTLKKLELILMTDVNTVAYI